MSKAAAMRFDEQQARALLDSGLNELTLDVQTEQKELLIRYLALMAKWNPVYNLTAIRETAQMVSHHLLDSLVIIPTLSGWIHGKTAPKILDVGSGGGLPGVVLAIMHPEWSVTLIDPVHKKTAFLQQVKSQLALTNLIIITGKVEDLNHAQSYDVITSRAFASIADFVRLSESVLAADGFFAAMKGVPPSNEITELEQIAPKQWQVKTEEIQVPQLNAQRHLIKITPLTQSEGHGL